MEAKSRMGPELLYLSFPTKQPTVWADGAIHYWESIYENGLL